MTYGLCLQIRKPVPSCELVIIQTLKGINAHDITKNQNG
jgi:hypothetical protein